ncbi:Alcohol dehydrogenase 4, mitochondrial [Cyphellophora attinorum]|uniref:Alcohol dehydrogenase 4, mitochondrial n=1 Tax=Cyphellophora attinorum TaxID=1664694 RepID=A0A0N1H753_9EURO|nr:Alcohol dehydrogenase 4, mitochondrial [Phialophora attinorum]KPI42155.1 Alcohol dehydrogenase 4, mitochondrial [Phialophora attinorum]
MGIEKIPKDMTAVQVVEFKQPYKIHKVPTPQKLGDYDILVKTAVASLCHTDAMVRNGVFPTKLPCTGSHEGTGIVVAKGSKVDTFKEGDRVMSGIPKSACGECMSCKKGDDYKQYCTNVEGMIGVIIDGAFADYHVADSRTSCHIPDSVSFADAAPLACAGVTIYRAIITSGAKKARGWPSSVLVVVLGKEEVVKQVQALTDGLGVESAINVSEHETSAPLACAITRMHGLVVQVSQPEMVSVPFTEFIFRDITIKGTLVAGQKISQEMLDVAGSSGVKVETQKFQGLDKVPDMVELAHSGKLSGKAVCVVDGSM